MLHFGFKAIIASRGYHVYKEITWSDAKVNAKVKIEIETNQRSISIDPYLCAVKAKHKYFDCWKTVDHVPREFSRYNYFFIKKEGGRVGGNVKSLNCKLWLIPSEDLEVPLLLTFSCPEKWARNKMKEFINDFYTYDVTGMIHNDGSSDESNIEINLELTEKEDDKEEVQTVVDNEEASKLLRQDATCIVIDDD